MASIVIVIFVILMKLKKKKSKLEENIQYLEFISKKLDKTIN